MLKWIKSSGISFICISIFILYLSSSSIFTQNDTFTSVVFLFLLVLFFIRRNKLDPFLFYVLIVWFAINFMSAWAVNTKQNISFITLTGVTIRILMPYLIVKIIGIHFFDKIVKYVYVLSIIGLIFFSIQLLFPGLFFSISDKLDFMTQDEQYEAGGWYIFVYMFSGWAGNRNCGFMWEPGAFSCILIFVLCFQLFRNKFKIDRYIIVLVMSIISTFSTSGFLALFLIMISFFLYRKSKVINPFYTATIFLVVALCINFYFTSDFMESKINRNIDEKDKEYTLVTGLERINRVEEFNRGLEQSFNWPFGNGVLNSEYRIQRHGYAVGPNSLSMILMQWGWVGMFFFLFASAKVVYFFTKQVFVSILLTASFCTGLYSNPYIMRYIIFAVFFYYYIYLNVSDNKKAFVEWQLNNYLRPNT